jgi:hypothetical protein
MLRELLAFIVEWWKREPPVEKLANGYQNLIDRLFRRLDAAENELEKKRTELDAAHLREVVDARQILELKAQAKAREEFNDPEI